MAGDWIKMRGNLWDDPRVGRICDLCDAGEAAVVGALYWLWATADQHTEDGAMPGLSLRQIDRKTGVPGFAEALIVVGWLLDDPQGVVIVKFEEHNGASAKRRCGDAQRKANSRTVSAPDADKSRTEHGQVTDEVGQVAELEKRREEKNREEQPKDKERSPSGSRLPADWVCPEEWLAHCREKRPDLDAESVACNFADWWHAKAGAGARKADWFATWRVWVSKESPSNPAGRPPPESFREREVRMATERYEHAVGIRRTVPANEIIEEVPHAAPRLLGR